jgi:hypothetical protein
LQEKESNCPDLGDRWTFTGVIPESSYLHTVHSGQRTQQEAQVFIEKIKANSDQQALFLKVMDGSMRKF